MTLASPFPTMRIILYPSSAIKSVEMRNLFCQFQIFFSPSAHRIRAVRIGRICAILDALSNLAQALQRDPGEWEKGSPVGIMVDSEELSEEDRNLVNAYHSLDMPVEGTLPEGLPALVSADQAKTILYGKAKEKAVSPELPDETSLSGDDDNALDYARIQPDQGCQRVNSRITRTHFPRLRVKIKKSMTDL